MLAEGLGLPRLSSQADSASSLSTGESARRTKVGGVRGRGEGEPCAAGEEVDAPSSGAVSVGGE